MSARPSSSSTTHLPIAPTVPQPIHILAAPTPQLIDSQLPSYLLPCVIDLLRTSSDHVVSRKRQQEDALRAEGLLPPLDKGKAKATGEEDDRRLVEEEMAKRVERIGLMVGGFVAEKLTLARPPLASHLDIIKFVCKDLFLYVYSKQIDNLRTNHRSHIFPPLVGLSSHRGPAADLEAAKSHLVFPQALIQGALARLGMNAVVTLESSGLPQFKGGAIAGTPSASTPAMGGASPNPQHASLSRSSVAPPAGPATTGLGIQR